MDNFAYFLRLEEWVGPGVGLPFNITTQKIISFGQFLAILLQEQMNGHFWDKKAHRT